MKKASGFFKKEEMKAINQAVTEAEKNTSGEIVPVLISSSGRYDRAEDIAGLWFACIVLAVTWALFQGVVPVTGWSSQTVTVKLGLLPILAVIIVSWLAGTAITSRVWFIRRLFTSRIIMQECVEEGAKRVFHEHKLRGTQDATGLLIYISLFERTVYVLGDQGISKNLSAKDWEKVRDLIIDGLRSGRAAEGLCQGIGVCGDLLAQHFPIKEDDVNELPNELITID